VGGGSDEARSAVNGNPGYHRPGTSGFQTGGGAPVALEAGGKSVRMGKDGAAPLSLEEWVDQQVSEAPHIGKKRDHATKASNLRMSLTSNGAFRGKSVQDRQPAKVTTSLNHQPLQVNFPSVHSPHDDLARRAPLARVGVDGKFDAAAFS
jgi:hypothetical protein